MPGGSKKGGGLEVKSAYKMKYQGKHSAFPFKSSPTKNRRTKSSVMSAEEAVAHNALAATKSHYGHPHGAPPEKLPV